MDANQLRTENGTEQLKPAQTDVGSWSCWKTVFGGVLHDFNNLLQVILAMSAMIRQALGVGHPANPHVEVIEQCALRAAALGQKLRTFTSPEQRGRGLLDLNGLLKDASRVLRAVLPPPGRLEVTAPERPVWVMADAGELLQTILDLCCEGAFRGPEQGGTLRLALEYAEASATSCLHLSVEPCAPEGSSSQRRASEVLLSHGGRLDVVREGAGHVEFGLTLPTVHATEAAASGSPVRTGSEMNEAMRDLLASMLRELGCVVLKVSQINPEQKANLEQKVNLEQEEGTT